MTHHTPTTRIRFIANRQRSGETLAEAVGRAHRKWADPRFSVLTLAR